MKLPPDMEAGHDKSDETQERIARHNKSSKVLARLGKLGL